MAWGDLLKTIGTGIVQGATALNSLASNPNLKTMIQAAPITPKYNLVGNKTDLDSARNIWGDKANYIDYTQTPDYKLNKGDFVLGGSGAEGMGALTDDLVNSIGAKRLAGKDRNETSSLIKGEFSKLFPESVAPSMPGMPTKDENGYYHNSPIPYPTLKSMEQYKADALSSLTPDINTKKTNIDTALNTSLANFEALKKSAQNQTDKNIVSANQDTERAKANDFNNALSHGLSRSSIMESGQGYADIANNVNKANIQSALTSRLGDIDTSITTAKNNAALEKSNLDSSLKDLVSAKALDLSNNDWNKFLNTYGINNSLTNNENALKSSQDSAQAAADQAAFNRDVTLRELGQKDRSLDQNDMSINIDKYKADISAAKGSGSGNSANNKTAAKNDLMSEVQSYLDSRDSASLRNLIDNEKDAIIRTFGKPTYDSIASLYWKWMEDPSQVLYPGVKKPNTSSTVNYSPYQ